MKAPLLVVLVVTASLGVLAVAVFALGDETLFVSPPEMVANELLHALSLGRTESAYRKLSRSAQRDAAPRDVRRAASALRARVGKVRQSRGEVMERRGDTVTVRMSVEGERAREEVLVRLVREDGVWALAQLGGFLPMGERNRSPARR